MTFIHAAVTVLREAGQPLSVHEITERALAKGLITTTAKTPEATMSAALYRLRNDGPIRRHSQGGRERAVRGSVRWSYVGDRS